jgi:hypothetical protein
MNRLYPGTAVRLPLLNPSTQAGLTDSITKVPGVFTTTIFTQLKIKHTVAKIDLLLLHPEWNVGYKDKN